jgi:4-amino-4-deoxy-L-arabinose transferase-like glycosyltransferase
VDNQRTVHAGAPASRPLRGWLALLALVAAVVLGSRILGPSDLMQNEDQCRTAAFTLDCAVNGRWLIPRDLAGEAALKPPLINWLGAPFVMAGLHTEFWLKLPAVLSALAGAAGVATGAAWTFWRLGAPGGGRDGVDAALAPHAGPLGLMTAAAWLASPEVMKQAYFLRPDILLVAALAWAWTLFSMAVAEDDSRRRSRLALAGWAAAGVAALAKGPMALAVVAFAVLWARAHRGRWSAVRTLRPALGLVIMLGIVALWLVPAYLSDPAHIGGRLLGGEVAGRFSTRGEGIDPARIPLNLLTVPGFYFERFGPWAFAAALGLVLLGRRAFSHAMTPAVLWLVIVTAVLIVMAGQSGSFNAPAYPAVAVLGVWAIARVVAGAGGLRARRAAGVVGALALATAVALGAREAVFSRGARTRTGEKLAEFARRAERTVGTDPVLFEGTGHNPVPLLMGRHTLRPVPADARWVIRPLTEGDPPVLESGPLVTIRASGEVRSQTGGLGLYDRAAAPPALTPPAPSTTASPIRPPT